MKNDLRQIAAEARLRAYAPYSGFLVGAALSVEDGEVFSGCNVENVSFSLTVCAERVCAVRAIERGARGFTAMAIVADTEIPIVPCGACRQFLAEFAPSLAITTWTLSGDSCEFSLSELLPLPNQGILQVPRGT